MESRFLLILTVLSYSIGCAQSLKKHTIKPGEKLEYKVHYGMIDAGRMTIETHKNTSIQDSIHCHKIEINGWTKGSASWFAKIKDKWITYIDTVTMMPYRFYRDIHENSYTREEDCVFDRKNSNTIVTVREGDEAAYVKTYPILNYTHDMVSSYFLLREQNFRKISAGDTIKLPVFFENEQFEVPLIFLGKDKIKTKFGKHKVAVISPVLPENTIFKGENAVKAYITWTHKKIPVKVKAKLIVGSVELDLIKYNNSKKAKL